MLAFLLLVCVSPSFASFFLPGQCDCPRLACQPPRPAGCPPANCPPQPPCGAFAAPTFQYQPTQYAQPQYPYQPQQYAVPSDDLEMRATAAGVPLSSAGQSNNAHQLKMLERLGEVSEEVKMVEEDLDLLPGLRKADNVRRAPVIQVSSQTTAAPEVTAETTTTASPSTTTKQPEAKPESVATTPGDDFPKCNSQVLKRLMEENMSDNSSESKRKINVAAEGKFGGNVDVVCSRGHFSYVFSSNLYCETTKGLVTCIAFRQAV